MKLIKIAQDHYVIVDDSEIQKGDLVFNEYQRQIKKFHAGSGIGLCRKITHSTNIDWNDVYYIPLQEVKELIGEVDVEKKKKEYLQKVKEEIKIESQDFRIGILGGSDFGFIAGYNQALEDNKEKKWTDEDLRKAWDSGREYANDYWEARGEKYMINFDNFIQSVQAKTEWEVEFVDGKLALKK